MSDPGDQRRKQRRQRDLAISKALRNRDETREKLLEQGRELARRRAENVERNRDDGSDATTGVHSTLPAMDSNEQAAARHSHSTVPTRPKNSTVPAAERLYGLGLYDRLAPGDEVSTVASSRDEDSGERTSVSADRTEGVSDDE